MGWFDNYQLQIDLSELANQIRGLEKACKYTENKDECEKKFKKLINKKIQEIFKSSEDQ